MILHHYPNSPFAEKIRAILGYKNLPWQSVMAPDMMPKPNLQALTGGYRRIPVLQIGADIYCDTALIVQVIEAAYPAAPLYAVSNAGVVDMLAQWADDALFWAAMGYNFKGAAALFANRPPQEAEQQAKLFAQDRSAMFGATPRQRPNDASSAYKIYLQRISTALGHQDFLMGSQPCLADFACYHPLWFTQTRVPQMAVIFDHVPNIRPWLGRMQAFSDAAKVRCTDLTAEQALDISRATKPALDGGMDQTDFCNEHGIELGDTVAVCAEKFGLEASIGKLVAATSTRYTLRREDAKAGVVHVHFPRVGFALKRAD